MVIETGERRLSSEVLMMQVKTWNQSRVKSGASVMSVCMHGDDHICPTCGLCCFSNHGKGIEETLFRKGIEIDKVILSTLKIFLSAPQL